jgi:hypothetical protein
MNKSDEPESSTPVTPKPTFGTDPERSLQPIWLRSHVNNIAFVSQAVAFKQVFLCLTHL